MYQTVNLRQSNKNKYSRKQKQKWDRVSTDHLHNILSGLDHDSPSDIQFGALICMMILHDFRGGSELRNMKQIQMIHIHDTSGNYYIYDPASNKNNCAGLNAFTNHMKPIVIHDLSESLDDSFNPFYWVDRYLKFLPAFSNEEPEKLLRQSYLPLWLEPLRALEQDIGFSFRPRSKNWLANFIPILMQEYTIEGKFRNRSLRDVQVFNLRQGGYAGNRICEFYVNSNVENIKETTKALFLSIAEKK